MLLLITILILFRRHIQDARSRNPPPPPHTPKINNWTRVIDPDTGKNNWTFFSLSLSLSRVCRSFLARTFLPSLEEKQKTLKLVIDFFFLWFSEQDETNSTCINKLKDKFRCVCIDDFFFRCQTRQIFSSLFPLEFLWTKIRSARE